MLTHNVLNRAMRCILLPLCGLALPLLVGCGTGKELAPTAPVEGTVTYQGKPVESGSVTFYPEGGERPASSLLGPGGTFTLTTFEKNDGAVIGKHKVTVNATSGSAEPGLSLDGGVLPLKYGDPAQTPLSYEVKEGKNTFEITLED